MFYAVMTIALLGAGGVGIAIGWLMGVRHEIIRQENERAAERKLGRPYGGLKL